MIFCEKIVIVLEVFGDNTSIGRIEEYKCDVDIEDGVNPDGETHNIDQIIRAWQRSCDEPSLYQKGMKESYSTC